jgi:MFS transporter, DHA1 family, multidrug resistance protein
MAYRSNRSYILVLSFLAATPPLATDMYLPAIPDLVALWQTTESTMNLSLVLWFASFSLALLVCGPLSDRFGRRPVLYSGTMLFIAASFLCATASSAWLLIAYRIVQGMGAAAPSAMAMAICRDRFTGHTRKKMLAYLGVILAVMPMIAPMIGSLILTFSTWQGIFIMQGLLSFISFLLALGLEETAGSLTRGGVVAIFSRYAHLFRNKEYMLTNSIIAFVVGPFFGHIAFSPIVYMSIFGQSKTVFSLCFGLNALFAMLGSFTCARLSQRVSSVRLLTIAFVGCILGGVSILLVGSAHYLFFAASMFVISFFVGISRPVSNHIVLEQVNEDIGAASSFLVFYQFLIAALCMWLVMLPWKAPIAAFGVLAVCLPLMVLSLWPWLLKRLREKGNLPE